jgi:hypothetical protein
MQEALAKISEQSVLGAVLVVCMFAIAWLFMFLTRQFQATIKTMREDLALERQACLERDQRMTRMMRRVARQQRDITEATTSLVKIVGDLAEKVDSKKKDWGHHS